MRKGIRSDLETYGVSLVADTRNIHDAFALVALARAIRNLDATEIDSGRPLRQEIRAQNFLALTRRVVRVVVRPMLIRLTPKETE